MLPLGISKKAVLSSTHGAFKFMMKFVTCILLNVLSSSFSRQLFLTELIQFDWPVYKQHG